MNPATPDRTSTGSESATSATGRVTETISSRRTVAVATQLFVKDGFKATSVKRIADALGVSPPALYWHFKSKQDLFLACMEHLLDEFVTNVADHVTDDDPRGRLGQFVTAHVLWKLQQSEAAGTYTSSIGMRDLVHALPPTHRSALIAKQREHLGTLRSILDDGVATGDFAIADPRIASFAIITMCEYVQSWFDPQGELAPDEVARLYVDLVEAMVRFGN